MSTKNERLIAKVKFNGKVTPFQHRSSNNNKAYYYYTDITDLIKSDVLIVQSPGGISLANFAGYTTLDQIDVVPKKWVISRAELGKLDKIEKEEAELERVEAEIRRIMRSYNDINKLELIAHFDGRLASLLDKNEGLSGSPARVPVEDKINVIALESTFNLR